MTKIINLLFALLLSLSIISCGSSDSGGDKSDNGSVKLPAVSGSTDSTPKKPDSSSDEPTGTSEATGCSEATLPGCPA